MSGKNSMRSWLSDPNSEIIDSNSITTAKILDANVTPAKISAGGAIFVLNGSRAAFAVESQVIAYQAYGPCKVLEVGISCESNGSASSTSIDVHAGATKATAASILTGGKLTMKAGSTIKVVKPATSSVADNGFVKLDVVTLASGTKSNFNCWIVLQQTA